MSQSPADTRPFPSPGSNTAPFIAMTVTFPILQTITLILAMVALALEFPAPYVSDSFPSPEPRYYKEILINTLHS